MIILEKIFHLNELKTNVRTEILAGIATFMTMAYIIFVNPAMISQAGMDFGSSMAATCIAAGIATILMGVYANYPIALAPGMGENAFFTYTICLGMGISWQTALACVFISGIIFVILTLTKIRQLIFEIIPDSIRYSIVCGIGLLIAFVGLIDAGLIVKHPATLVALGDVLNPATIVSVCGIIIMSFFLMKKIKGALLWGILVTAVLGIFLGVIKYQGLVSAPPSISATFFKLDFKSAFDLGFASIIFIFLFMDMFDTVGTLAGVAELGGFMRHGKMPRLGKAMLADSIGTCVGAVCGTPTVTSYAESAAGVASGAKTGLASVTTGILFFCALFFSPIIKMIGGGYQTPDGLLLYPVIAPALIIVGSMMLHPIAKIDWQDYSESIPAFIVIIMMPLTFSIATGIAFGFISYVLLKVLAGQAKKVHWLIYVFTILFVLRFLYLKALA